MKRLPRNPQIRFVRRKKAAGETFYVPKKDSVGSLGAKVERHVYNYNLPKVRFGKDNGNKLAAYVERTYNRLLDRYGDSLQGIAYSIQGKGATDVDAGGKPDWERKHMVIRRNYMAGEKSARDATERIRAYGDNDFSVLISAGVFRASKSTPVFFLPKVITISVISKPGMRLTQFNARAKSVSAPWELKEMGVRPRDNRGRFTKKKRRGS